MIFYIKHDLIPSNINYNKHFIYLFSYMHIVFLL